MNSPQSRYLKYDLTVICVGMNIQQLASQYACIEKLDLPAKTQILVVDGGRSAAVSAGLKAKADRYLSVPSFPYRLQDEWKGAALDAVRKFARGKEVLLLGGIVDLEPRAWRDLQRGKKEKNAQVYGGRIWNEKYRLPMAWRPAEGNTHSGFKLVPVLKSAKRVYASSLDLVLLDNRLMQEFQFKYNPQPGQRYQCLEIFTGSMARWLGYRWFVDGRVRNLARPERFKRKMLSQMSGLKKEILLPSVSVIILVKNGAGMIRALLDSLMAMNYPKDLLEFILVDNGSSDRILEIAGQFPGVRIVKEEKVGSYAARNQGIREARYDLVAFIDADCVVSESWLMDLVKAMMNDPLAGCVAGANQAVHPDNIFSKLERDCWGMVNHQDYFTGKGLFITMNVLFIKKIFHTCGFFDEREISGSDIDFALRMQKESLWKIESLQDRGIVKHQDFEGLRSFFSRYYSNGYGHYALYQKHPEHLEKHYQWMPGSRWELFLQMIKRALTTDIFLYRHLPRAEHRRLKWFYAFRCFLQQWGYADRRKELFREKKEASRSGEAMVFYDGRLLQWNSGLFWKLWTESRERTVIHMGPQAGLLVSYYQRILACFGGTAVWDWSPSFFNFFPWESLRGRWKGEREYPFSTASAKRVAKILAARNIKKILVEGDPSAFPLEDWQFFFSRLDIQVERSRKINLANLSEGQKYLEKVPKK